MKQSIFDKVRQIALSLPGVVESVSYGTPSFKLKDKLLARFHQDGESLVLKMDFESRDFLLQVDPEVYYITDHYKNYPYVLVRLLYVDLEDLKGHFLKTWYSIAPKKLITEFEKMKH